MDVQRKFKGAVVSRVRQGHVLFADFGGMKALCKDTVLGMKHFAVLMHGLRVGDILYCIGFIGYDYQGTPLLFVTEVFAVEPGKQHILERDENELHRDDDFLVMLKPSGMLANEDTRHRFERGTALRVDAKHVVGSPDVETSGPAVFTWTKHENLWVQRRTYLALVAGTAENTLCTAALRPSQGKPHEEAETFIEVLWKGSDSSLVRATITGCERPAQARKHLHILGCPVWGDRRFGQTRANKRNRGVYGLAKPWFHLSILEICGDLGLKCFCAIPQDLLKVLRAVGCMLDMPRKSEIVRCDGECQVFVCQEMGLVIQAYIDSALCL